MFRNRVRYFWRTVCCFIFGISRIKFILLKKNKNRINIFYNFLFEKLFYKLVDGIDNIYFEYFFLNWGYFNMIKFILINVNKKFFYK